MESTVICFDNSDYMRNGDMTPTRLQCQQDVIAELIRVKLRANAENAVSLLTIAGDIKVVASLTQDCGRLVSLLHQVELEGNVDVFRGIKTANLVLKNRSNRNHKMRIVVFVGSPLDELVEKVGEAEFIKLAKKLKKENVKVDFVLFGEATSIKNQIILNFVDVINGPDGNGSNVVVVVGDSIRDALMQSEMCSGTHGIASGTFQFGVDAEEDPELALALRVSMEEERQRQQQGSESVKLPDSVVLSNVKEELPPSRKTLPSLEAMSEEEQLQLALRMSVTQEAEEAGTSSSFSMAPAANDTTAMDTDETGQLAHDAERLQQLVDELPVSDQAAYRNGGKTEDEEEKK